MIPDGYDIEEDEEFEEQELQEAIEDNRAIFNAEIFRDMETFG